MSSNWGSNSRSNSSGSSSRSDVENSFDADEELLQIGTRCMEVNLFFFFNHVSEIDKVHIFFGFVISCFHCNCSYGEKRRC